MSVGSRWGDLILNECVCVCGCIHFVCVCVYNWDDCEDHFIVRGIEEVGKDR